MSLALSPDLRWSAVIWLLRLPLLGVQELASVLGVDERTSTGLLVDLTRLRWVEWMATQSPELESERLFYLTEPAVGALVTNLSVSSEQLAEAYATSHRERLLRVLRIETTVGLGRMLAALAQALAREDRLTLFDARTLAWGRRSDRWWPPHVEAYGCLRSGAWYAPFFVAWDRAGAPAAHRRARVAGWYSFRDGEANPWGQALPPILVVCPGERQVREWSRAVLASADRRGCAPLSIYLTTLLDVLDNTALGPVWRRIDGVVGAPLAERLHWTLRPPAQENVLQRAARQPDLLSLTNPQQRRTVATTRPRASGGAERLARTAATLGSVQKELLEWLGHHPYLSASDLGVLLNLGEATVAKHLVELKGHRLVRSVLQRVAGDAGAPSRYFLTQDGLRLLAARDGVPPRRYARHGVLAAEHQGGETRLAGLLRYFEHTVGANSFFVRLAAEAREPGRRMSHRFVAWLNSAEGQEWFRWQDRLGHIWPDGRAIYEVDGRRFDLLLEWDRGLMRRRDLLEKFRSYAAWVESCGSQIAAEVRLLIVTNVEQTEATIAATVHAMDTITSRLRAWTYTTTRRRLERSGALGASWKSAACHDGSVRSWLPPRHAQRRSPGQGQGEVASPMPARR